MMQSTVGLLLLGLLAVLIVEPQEVTSMAMTPDMATQCDPEFLQQIDSPKIKKICSFLQNYAAAMQQYNKDSGSYMQYPDMMENGVKRQDVDHVFLRFGRRRR